MKKLKFEENSSSANEKIENTISDEEISNLIQDYLKKVANITDYRKKEQILMEMLSILISKINQIAKEGDLYEVGNYLSTAAYYLEEFDFKEAQQIYLKSIEYYDKYMFGLQKSGLFEEASRIANHISEIYHSKINDFVSEKKYLTKCIEYKIALMELVKDFEPRKVALIFYNLGELYIKIEEWRKAIEIIKSGMEIAKSNSFYDIVSNLYFNLSDAYLFSGNEQQSRRIFEDARDYFANIERSLLEETDYYQLSQIFQIQKNINSALNDVTEFKNFSRKEAMAYIKLAKKIIQAEKDFHKIASFYRGAALCYRETESDLLEAATSFYIAGNYFEKNEEFNEASYCFNDAAELFEQADFPEKAVDLFILAADYALMNSDYEFAIEKLFNAYDLTEIKNLKGGKEELANKINENLEKLSENEANNERFFIAGTLLLETLPYYRKLGFTNTCKETKQILEKIEKYYSQEYQVNSEDIKNTTVSYILTLDILVNIALEKYDKVKQLMANFNGDGSSNLSSGYKNIIEEILNAKNRNIKFDPGNLDRRLKKIYSNSEEIRLISNYIFNS